MRIARRAKGSLAAVEGGADSDDNVDLTIDFGFFELSALGDKVYDDDDGGDGVEDDGEDGVPGVNVYNEDGELVGSDVTDEDGMYLIEGLLPGNVTVEFDLGTIPDGSSVGPGTVSVDPGTGRTAEFDLGVGETDLTIDLGLLDVDAGAGGVIPFTGGSPGRPVAFAFTFLLVGLGLVELQRQQNVAALLLNTPLLETESHGEALSWSVR